MGRKPLPLELLEKHQTLRLRTWLNLLGDFTSHTLFLGLSEKNVV